MSTPQASSQFHEFSVRRRMRHSTLISWGISIGLHLAIFVTAVIVIPPLVQRALQEPSREQVIIPDTQLAVDGHFGGIPNPGLGKDPTRQEMQENDPSADSQGWAQRKSQNLADTLAASANDGGDLIARGPNSTIGRGHDNNTFAALSGDNSGSLASFGPRGGGGGVGPKSRIFGHGGNVHSVIYVCDGSGSMVGGKDDVLKAELKKAVANLSPVQAFNMLFFRESPDFSSDIDFISFSDQLVMASPNNKSRLFDFATNKMKFGGGTNPLPALQEAFREKPQLIFLLTDGEFDDPSSAEVLKRIDAMNASKTVKINTILLLGSKAEKDEYKDFEAIMTQIATDNGGVYKKFYSDDF